MLHFILACIDDSLSLGHDAPPLADLEYVELDVPPPPRDQGLFSPFLVPGGIRAKARVLRAPPFSATRI